ncbi:hypothetical protein ABID25_000245 [Mesorhizobium abyssinicae]
MSKEIVEVPVLSAAVRTLGVPLSLVTRGAGLVFVSGMPPLDRATGRLVKGDIEVQAETSLKALKHCLEAAGSSLDKADGARLRCQCRLLQRHQPGLCQAFPREPAIADLRAGGVMADGVRYRDRVCGGGVRVLILVS